MSTEQNIQKLLETCRSSQEFRAVVNAACGKFGEVVNATLLCSKQPPAQTFCVVDFARENTKSNLCASALGGQVFGFNSVVFKFQKHPDFGCVKGFPSDSPTCSCTARV